MFKYCSFFQFINNYKIKKKLSLKFLIINK